MKKRSEKAAWEIMGLLSEYSEQELSDAFSLIRSRKMIQGRASFLQSALETLLTAGEISQNRRSQIEPSVVQKTVSEPLEEFREGILSSRYLPNTKDLHEFASDIGIIETQRIRNRRVFAREIASRLASLDAREREKLIDIGRNLYARDVSSLKGWSDVIVKKD